MIQVKEVTTKKEMKKFVGFPLKLYKGNKNYCPAFFGDEVKLLDKEKSAYAEFADTKFFLAYRDGEVVGRLAVIINHAYIEKWEDKCARFSRYDVIDDIEVSKALFEAGEKYARECGMERINGPMGYVDLDREGLLVEGFDWEACYGGSYNHAYYKDHLEKLGFVKQVDWLERRITVPNEKPAKYAKVAEIAKTKFGVREIINNDTKVGPLVKEYKDRIFALLDECYGGLHGTVPFTKRVVDELVASISLILKAKYISLVEDPDGNLVGFGLVFPPVWNALNTCKGKLTPKGILALLKAVFGKHDIVEMALIATKPEWQNKGVTAVIMDRIFSNFIEGGIKYAETNATLESNTAINNLWQQFEHVQHKRKRCYVKELN